MYSIGALDLDWFHHRRLHLMDGRRWLRLAMVSHVDVVAGLILRDL